MVQHTQTIRPQQPTNCLSIFDHFVGLSPEGLILSTETLNYFLVMLLNSHINFPATVQPLGCFDFLMVP